MITTFRGLQIPPGLTKENAHELCMIGDCSAYCIRTVVSSGVFCAGVPCGDCICYENHRENLKKLLEMWEKEDMDTKMPELKAGDVVKCDKIGYMLVGNTAAYPLMMVDGLYGPQGFRVELKRILDGPYFPLRLYRTGASGFDQHALKAIDNDLGGGYIIWERPKVKEMTVDQISEALGYKIVVVGEK